MPARPAPLPSRPGTALRDPLAPPSLTPDPVADLLVVGRDDVTRAPLLAALLAQRLAWLSDEGVVAGSVGSAGVAAQPGAPASEAALVEGRARLVDLAGHRSRPVTVPLLHAAALVLTTTEGQRRHCRQLLPSAAGRTFTVLELARLTPSVVVGEWLRPGALLPGRHPPGRRRRRRAATSATPPGPNGLLGAVAAAAAAARGHVPPADGPEDLAPPDPGAFPAAVRLGIGLDGAADLVVDLLRVASEATTGVSSPTGGAAP